MTIIKILKNNPTKRHGHIITFSSVDDEQATGCRLCLCEKKQHRLEKLKTSVLPTNQAHHQHRPNSGKLHHHHHHH
ncbi:Molybdopterin synthase sulfur carrier subunit [Trichinella spiralis]|uniref:Molybdopterin synthase sulfur carrier subunit n=1 Tax=Trichinella spiralis TaxID=6334 RepID=A0ABR3L049_TRISP